MTRLILALGILACAIGLAVLPAFAAPQCAPLTAIMEGLARNYGEYPARQAMSANSTIVFWTENAETGTWTAFEARPDGVACLLIHGTGFETLTPPPEGIPG